MRNPMQAGQQTYLALTMDPLANDVCCISETRIQDPSSVIKLTAPSVSRQDVPSAIQEKKQLELRLNAIQE